MSFQSVILVGNLTRDPEVRYIPSGTAVCDLGIAINERKKVGDHWEEETLFVDVTCWGRTAEICGKFLSKGSQVLISGKLKMDSWVDKDGNKRNKIKVVCNEMKMMGNKNDVGCKNVKTNVEGSSQDEYSGPVEDVEAPTIDDNSIPF
jgi:single-strand DNA-binding protein